MTEQKISDGARQKGIFLLPNLFTTAGLFSGFYAVVASMNGQFEAAAIAIFVAMIFDGVDGRVARLTNTESAFGAEYDSMADMVSFGIAPALVVYNWALHDLGKIGWLAAFVYTVGAALRLARFNTQVGIADKRFFQGLASPAAAALIAGMVWFAQDMEFPGNKSGVIACLITVISGLLMVSNFKYHSFKGIDLKGRVPFFAVLLIVLVFIVVAVKPAVILFTLFAAYAVSGPVYTIRTVKDFRFEHVVGDEEDLECNAPEATSKPTEKKADSVSSEQEQDKS
ncbi:MULTISPECIES: CDP-diacylglycerol--serine O-phosphatidyltransferase [unclassified Agarivorans]|uniref:CDP-diacylglycerol--serine O-phosphatidyltransferase n=1 Tax=unclassified Agarivorans TaxID=2636026 RepID=UPI0010D34F61|nr:MULTISPECIES: CDP-diacylglycerol--serine O-phosphatidyltransferase [unclassified Agarivorans]MDO6685066.1 CDP-diacylglycerol--serine O-phosphatidyltransferase [Agarivorans sp. 3_MG-2023]MDO6715762.1 CDP-diacylglycerol--serine O-phosphatidyltransferase [Agarivorans sp. 2_MG-2023]GDY27808.1 CDP-diacylglycerol--serine O-phosphatidyltransferase [Agarivorans sp. Toyoura001]